MDIKIKITPPFNLEATLNCGQCFRFEKLADGRFKGVVKNIVIEVEQQKDTLIFYNAKKEDILYLKEYFDLNTDYNKINEEIAQTKMLKEIVDSEKGIRILKQEPFEALISFIISQNNNIPRIKKIIKTLCENFGEKINDDYTFPKAETLYKMQESDLAFLKAGFRARYIIDAAKKVQNKTVDLEKIKSLDYLSAKEELKKIVGVGDKVADCTLLFGFYKTEAFPIDVWMKKALETYFKDGIPKKALKHGGILQQYIFNYIRKQNGIT